MVDDALYSPELSREQEPYTTQLRLYHILSFDLFGKG